MVGNPVMRQAGHSHTQPPIPKDKTTPTVGGLRDSGISELGSPPMLAAMARQGAGSGGRMNGEENAASILLCHAAGIKTMDLGECIEISVVAAYSFQAENQSSCRVHRISCHDGWV